MIELNNLINNLAELLDTKSFQDYCVNGLQVEGRDEVQIVTTGVSASARLFEEAVSRKADAVIVHHGLFWKNTQHPLALTGALGRRVKLLHQNNISLLGYHLPLDGHAEFGNNAIIAKRLGLEGIDIVPITGTENPIAAVGSFSEPVDVSTVIENANSLHNANGLLLSFGPKMVQRVFILAGGGGSFYMDAVKHHADLMITGELKEDVVRYADELKLNLYAAGHYNSEKWGIIELGNFLSSEFGLNVDFVDVPNPV